MKDKIRLLNGSSSSCAILILFCLLIPIGCVKEGNKTTDSTKPEKILSCDDASLALYYPLTAEKLNNVLNGNESFGLIVLHYFTRNDSNQGTLHDNTELGLDAGAALNENYYSQIGIYRGGLVHDIARATPEDNYYNYLEMNFTLAEVQVIFNYLLAHSDYFFNAEEYGGDESYMGEYICVGGPVNDGNYCFCMSIDTPGNPGTYPVPAWAISKCVDEYPEQGTPLYGLFQILENDFIDEFE